MICEKKLERLFFTHLLDPYFSNSKTEFIIFHPARVPAHRLVLCAANEHFAEHFTKTTPEQQTTEIYFENVSQDILFMMIDFCYTGEIDVTNANVDTILAAAHEFQFFNLKQKCAEYCKTILRPKHCLWIWPLAEKYELNELSELAFQQALLHFLDIWQYESLKYLEIHQIRALLSHDLLNIESEEDVFNAVVEWIEFNLEERMPQIQDVLETVRVGLITNSVSKTIKTMLLLAVTFFIPINPCF